MIKKHFVYGEVFAHTMKVLVGFIHGYYKDMNIAILAIRAEGSASLDRVIGGLVFFHPVVGGCLYVQAAIARLRESVIV